MGLNRSAVVAFVLCGAVVLGIGIAVMVNDVPGATGPGFVAMGIGLLACVVIAAAVARRHNRRIESGQPGSVTVVSVGDTGTRLNGRPRLELELDLRSPPGAPARRIRTTKSVGFDRLTTLTPGSLHFVSVLDGDRIEFVDFDTFVGLGGTDVPPTCGAARVIADLDDLWRVEALERLAALHRSGALTDAEFAREKARLLAD